MHFPRNAFGTTVRIRQVELKRRAIFVALRRTFCYTTLMTKTIAQRELRNENAKVIDEVVAGESFVVTRNGIPVAELRPLFAPRRTVVPKSAIADFAETGPRIDTKRFRADLDNFVDQEL